MCILKRSRRIFNQINIVVFNQHLPPIKFTHCREKETSGQFFGCTFYHAFNELKEVPRIEVNQMYNKNPDLLFDTVAHETAHYVQFLHKLTVNHDHNFVEILSEIGDHFSHDFILEYDY